MVEGDMSQYTGTGMEMEFGDIEGIGGDPAMMTGGDPAMMGGQTPAGGPPSGGDTSGTKIDYSAYDPVPYKKTATIVNYFISNSAQFLNSFTQVAESKLHEVDERLDEIEQILSLYEAKLDLDDEFFEKMPEMPEAQQLAAQPEVVARTENPLADAIQPKTKQPVTGRGTTRQRKTEMSKKRPGTTSGKGEAQPAEKAGYVPPPPPDGAKIPPPPGMPAVKVFPISSGPPPSIMSFPNIAAAPPEAAGAGEGGTAGGEGGAAAAADQVDDGFTPEQRRKIQLEDDDSFKKFRIMYRNKIPLFRIWDRIRSEKVYAIEDINLFATDGEIEQAHKDDKI